MQLKNQIFNSPLISEVLQNQMLKAARTMKYLVHPTGLENFKTSGYLRGYECLWNPTILDV